MNERLLNYAINHDGKLVFIDDVANGLACNCICPHCKSHLIARNQGRKKQHHFAHEGNSDCGKGYESALHLLAKEIIEEEKKVMLPYYKNIHSYPSQCIFQSIEIEERNDSDDLQPDCVGVTEDGMRILIEIYVTHSVDEVKTEKIVANDLNCLEIEISRDFPLDKERLKDFLLNKQEKRKWINFPYGDKLIIQEYRNNHRELIAKLTEKCENCQLFKEKVYEAYQNLLKNYRNRILSWAVPFLEMSPEEIIKHDISLKFTIVSDRVYVEYHGMKYYVYPKYNKFKNSEEKRLCDSTYWFIKNLSIIAQVYTNSEFYHDQCFFLKREFEYQGKSYSFCTRDKSVKIPLGYWKDVVLMNNLYMPLSELKDRNKRSKIVKIYNENK